MGNATERGGRASHTCTHEGTQPCLDRCVLPCMREHTRAGVSSAHKGVVTQYPGLHMYMTSSQACTWAPTQGMHTCMCMSTHSTICQVHIHGQVHMHACRHAHVTCAQGMHSSICSGFVYAQVHRYAYTAVVLTCTQRMRTGMCVDMCAEHVFRRWPWLTAPLPLASQVQTGTPQSNICFTHS